MKCGEIIIKTVCINYVFVLIMSAVSNVTIYVTVDCIILCHGNDPRFKGIFCKAQTGFPSILQFTVTRNENS